MNRSSLYSHPPLSSLIKNSRPWMIQMIVKSFAAMLMISGCKQKMEANGQQKPVLTQSSQPKESIPCHDLLTVGVVYPGASPEEGEHHILLPLEKAIRDIADSGYNIHGLAKEGYAQLSITRSLPDLTARDVESLKIGVRNAIKGAIPFLPEGAERPLLSVEPSSDRFIVVAAYNNNRSPAEISRWSHHLRNAIQTHSGIRRVDLIGDVRREIIIHVDPVRLEAYKLGIDDVANAIRQSLVGTHVTDIHELMKSVWMTVPNINRQLSLADVATIEDTVSQQPVVRIGRDRTVFLIIRVSPKIPDHELSAMVSRLIDESPPGSKLFVSKPITTSQCHGGPPSVSGPVVIFETSEDATRLEEVLSRQAEEETPIFILEGSYLLLRYSRSSKLPP